MEIVLPYQKKNRYQQSRSTMADPPAPLNVASADGISLEEALSAPPPPPPPTPPPKANGGLEPEADLEEPSPVKVVEEVEEPSPEMEEEEKEEEGEGEAAAAAVVEDEQASPEDADDAPVAADDEEEPAAAPDDEPEPADPPSAAGGLIRLTLGKPFGIVFEPAYDDSSYERGVRICELPKTGAAAQSRKLQVGDELLSINDKTVSRMMFEDIMDFIMEVDPGEVHLLFRRPETDSPAKVKWEDEEARERKERKKSSRRSGRYEEEYDYYDDDDTTFQSDDHEYRRRRRRKKKSYRRYESESFLDILIDTICAIPESVFDDETVFSRDDSTYVTRDDSTYDERAAREKWYEYKARLRRKQEEEAATTDEIYSAPKNEFGGEAPDDEQVVDAPEDEGVIAGDLEADVKLGKETTVAAASVQTALDRMDGEEAGPTDAPAAENEPEPEPQDGTLDDDDNDTVQIAQISELLNYVYGKTSYQIQVDRVSTIMRAYEGREAVLLKLLETKALAKASSANGSVDELPSFLQTPVTEEPVETTGDIASEAEPPSQINNEDIMPSISAMSSSLEATEESPKPASEAGAPFDESMETEEDAPEPVAVEENQTEPTPAPVETKKKKKKRGLFGGIFKKKDKTKSRDKSNGRAGSRLRGRS